jgi:hypothetical protein
LVRFVCIVLQLVCITYDVISSFIIKMATCSWLCTNFNIIKYTKL